MVRKDGGTARSIVLINRGRGSFLTYV